MRSVELYSAVTEREFAALMTRNEMTDESKSYRLIAVTITVNLSYLACSTNLPTGLYILTMFFSLFLYLCLMIDFLDPVCNGPKFQDW